MNNGFFDMNPEDRAHWYDKAREETGMDFFDLPPEERGRYYERAEEARQGWDDQINPADE